MNKLNKWVCKAKWSFLLVLENLGEHFVFPWHGMSPTAKRKALDVMPSHTRVHIAKSFLRKDLTAWRNLLNSIKYKVRG